MKPILSIVAPMYNEGALVRKYCEETLAAVKVLRGKYEIELVLVNDGSKDKTYQEMISMQKQYEMEISLVNLSRNFGLEGAVRAGIEKAIGEAVVVMDADLQDPPALIVDMVSAWEAGADVVIASRVARSNDGFFKKLGAGIYYQVLDFLSGKLRLEKAAANFRLLSRKALQQVLELPEKNAVFRVIVPFIGMKTAVVTYDRDRRFAGETKYNFASMIRYALDSITGISIEPLRKILWMIPIIMITAILSGIALYFFRETWQVGGILLLSITSFFMILVCILMMLGEYIGQIMIEVKARPASIIYEYRPGKIGECHNGICQDGNIRS